MIYLLVIWGDVWPEIKGPFDSYSDRDAYVGKFRAEKGDEHGLYKLFANAASVYPYGGGEMDSLVEAYKDTHQVEG